MDFEDRPRQPQNQHIARAADITLATADDIQLDLDDPGYGFDFGPSEGIGSQDFELDLGLDIGDGLLGDADRLPEDETLSVEVGRDAMTPHSERVSVASHLLANDHLDGGFDLLSVKSREPSEHGFGADMDFGPDLGGVDIDLGLDLGDTPMDITMGENDLTPLERTPSRACKCI